MSTLKANRHISHMANLIRHFNEKPYVRFYSVFRKAYALGGDELVTKVFNDAQDEKHQLTPKGIRILNKAFRSFIANQQAINDVHFELTPLQCWNYINEGNTAYYNGQSVMFWKRDNGNYAVRYACDSRTEEFARFSYAYDFVMSIKDNTYGLMTWDGSSD